MIKQHPVMPAVTAMASGQFMAWLFEFGGSVGGGWNSLKNISHCLQKIFNATKPWIIISA